MRKVKIPGAQKKPVSLLPDIDDALESRCQYHIQKNAGPAYRDPSRVLHIVRRHILDSCSQKSGQRQRPIIYRERLVIERYRSNLSQASNNDCQPGHTLKIGKKANQIRCPFLNLSRLSILRNSAVLCRSLTNLEVSQVVSEKRPAANFKFVNRLKKARSIATSMVIQATRMNDEMTPRPAISAFASMVALQTQFIGYDPLQYKVVPLSK